MYRMSETPQKPTCLTWALKRAFGHTWPISTPLSPQTQTELKEQLDKGLQESLRQKQD